MTIKEVTKLLRQAESSGLLKYKLKGDARTRFWVVNSGWLLPYELPFDIDDIDT